MASPFASHYTETIPFDVDPGQTITIQRVTGRDLERAQAVAAAQVVAGRGFAATIRRMLEDGATDAATRARVLDPLAGYDRTTLVVAGLKGWSYVDAKQRPLPVTAKTIDDLDDDALECIARAVLTLTKPALFQTTEEREAAQKNDSATSTAT